LIENRKLGEEIRFISILGTLLCMIAFIFKLIVANNYYRNLNMLLIFGVLASVENAKWGHGIS
jgi:hypothetical protein